MTYTSTRILMKTRIFKYIDEYGALESLKDDAVLLNVPEEFNDPFDCLYSITKEEEKIAYRLYVNYLLFERFYKCLISPESDNGLKRLISLHKKNIINEHIEIQETNKYIQQDYLDQYYSIAKNLLHKKEKALRQGFHKTMRKVFEDMRKRVLISCFGSDYKSVLMWSHYSNKHQGACIEYEIDDNDFKPVQYNENFIPFRLYDCFEILFASMHLKTDIDYTKDEYQFLIEPLLMKSSDWSYEKEIRCVYSLKKKDHKIFEKTIIKDEKPKVLQLLSMPKPVAVYVGCKANKDFIGKIKSVNENVPVFKLKIKENKYEFEKTKT